MQQEHASKYGFDYLIQSPNPDVSLFNYRIFKEIREKKYMKIGKKYEIETSTKDNY